LTSFKCSFNEYYNRNFRRAYRSIIEFM